MGEIGHHGVRRCRCNAASTASALSTSLFIVVIMMFCSCTTLAASLFPPSPSTAFYFSPCSVWRRSHESRPSLRRAPPPLAFSSYSRTCSVARVPPGLGVEAPTAAKRRPRTGRACSTTGGPRIPTSLRASSSSAAAAAPPKDASATLEAVSSTLSIVLLDVAFRRLLRRLSVAFPSSLAGCGALFATLVGLHSMKAEWGDGLYETLSPGATVLAKWLPVFFVPSLVTLPLAGGLGSSLEVAKVGAVIIGGFFFTLLTTAWSVIGIRKLQNGGSSTVSNDEEEEVSSSSSDSPAADAVPSSPPAKAFSDETSTALTTMSLAGAIATTIAAKTGATEEITTLVSSVTLLLTTLASFVFGARLPKSFTKVVHPLITCTSLTWAMSAVLGSVLSMPFKSMLGAYKTGSLSPLIAAGAGDVLLFMLGPAVISLACQMYDRKKLMKENLAEVGTAVGVSSFGGLFGTALTVRILNVASPILRLSLLSRNITSPLAMAIAAMLGADASLAVTFVVVTGVFGANFGASVLDVFGIKDAVARGLGIGAAAHGLGTAAFANEKDAFPFAAIAMALTASFCTVLVSIPVIKGMLLRIALG